MDNVQITCMRLRTSATAWLKSSVQSLECFVEKDKKGFSDYFRTSTNRKHTVSTARALISVKNNPWFSKSRTLFPSDQDCLSLFDEIKTPNGYWSSDTEIENNIYESAQILWALELNDLGDEEDLKRHKKQLESYIINYNPHSSIDPDLDYDVNHPFQLLLSIRALTVNDKLNGKVKQKVESDLYSELCAQLAFLKSEDLHNFDLVRLGLATASLLIIKSTWKPNVLEHAKNCFMEMQLSQGLWPNTRMIRVGKNFVTCSSFEILWELVRNSSPQWIETQIKAIVKIFQWLESNNIGKNNIPVWRADTTPHIMLWFNALVFDLLADLENRLSLVSHEYSINILPSKKPSSIISWSKIIDTGFKKELENRIIKPFQNQIPAEAARSAIFFGPHGTSKTSVARSLAKEIGNWPTVELGPGDFCINGIDNIMARTKSIFDNLFELKDALIIFDEIDELVVAREIEQDKLGRFLTTSMLPLLQDLRDKKEVVFIFITNHIKRYDEAIKRPGRFDLILPVGPLEKNEQRNFLIEQLKTNDDPFIDQIMGELDGVRTIKELLNLVSFLGNEPQKDWREISKIWAKNNKPSINGTTMKQFSKDLSKKRG